MFDFPIRIPHLIVMLTAAAWILFLFQWKPEFLALRPLFRLLVSLIEGFMVGLVWAVFLRLSLNDPLEGLLWSGLLTSSLWTGLVYYSRYRYSQSIHAKT
jgi:hypothetical protein